MFTSYIKVVMHHVITERLVWTLWELVTVYTESATLSMVTVLVLLDIQVKGKHLELNLIWGLSIYYSLNIFHLKHCILYITKHLGLTARVLVIVSTVAAILLMIAVLVTLDIQGKGNNLQLKFSLNLFLYHLQ